MKTHSNDQISPPANQFQASRDPSPGGIYEQSRRATEDQHHSSLVRCTFGFIDIAIWEGEWTPCLRPGAFRRGPACEARIRRYIKETKYPDLNAWIGLRDYDEDGADITVVVHFRCAGLDDFVGQVVDLHAITGVDPNAFDARYGRTKLVLSEQDFDCDDSLMPTARARVAELARRLRKLEQSRREPKKPAKQRGQGPSDVNSN